MKKKQFEALVMIFAAIIIGFIDGVIYGRLAMVFVYETFGFFGWLLLYKTLMGKYPYLLLLSWMAEQNNKRFKNRGSDLIFYQKLMKWWEEIALDEVKDADDLDYLEQLIKLIPSNGDAYLIAQAKIDNRKQI